MAYVLVCSDSWITDAAGAPACPAVIEQYEYSDPSSVLGDLLIATEFSPEAAGMGFGGGLTLFAAGLGIGFALKFIRRL